MSHELRTPLNAIIGLTEMMVTNAARFGTEKAHEPLQLETRHSTLSAAMSVARSRKPSRASLAWVPTYSPAASMSTRIFTPYCAPTEQPTAAPTAVARRPPASLRNGRETQGDDRCTDNLHCGRNSPTRLHTRFRAMQWNARAVLGSLEPNLTGDAQDPLEATA